MSVIVLIRRPCGPAKRLRGSRRPLNVGDILGRKPPAARSAQCRLNRPGPQPQTLILVVRTIVSRIWLSDPEQDQRLSGTPLSLAPFSGLADLQARPWMSSAARSAGIRRATGTGSR